MVVVFDDKMSSVVVLNLAGGCDAWGLYDSGFELTTGSRKTNWFCWWLSVGDGAGVVEQECTLGKEDIKWRVFELVGTESDDAAA